MTTIASIAFTDAEIRRQAAGTARDLKDPRHQGLRLRFGSQRPRGSWFLIVRRAWHKIGTFPEMSAKDVLAALPEHRQRLSKNPEAVIGQAGWVRVEQVLVWHRDRVMRDRALSEKRKTQVRSAIDCHLVPRLGVLLITQLNRAQIDERLMWPLQQEFSLGYVRLILRVLMMAFASALRLHMLDSNPMAAIKFGDFVQAKIKPKAAHLHGMHAEPLLAALADRFEEAPAEGMLALMMLAHGSRIGETRQARWRDISLAERVWLIPAANTKTRVQHELPLTEQVCALLQRYREQQVAAGGEQLYLFPGTGSKPMGEKQASAVFAKLGAGEWTSHDLRKLARTTWADLGVDYLIGELLLNHSMGYSAKTYIHTTAEELKREALEKWHGWLDARGFDRIHRQICAGSAVIENGADVSSGAPLRASREFSQERLDVAGGEGAE